MPLDWEFIGKSVGFVVLSAPSLRSFTSGGRLDPSLNAAFSRQNLRKIDIFLKVFKPFFFQMHEVSSETFSFSKDFGLNFEMLLFQEG